MVFRYAFLVGLMTVLTSCAPSQIKREIGLVDALPASQCPAEAAVDWAAYDYFDFEDIEADFIERARQRGWPETADGLDGDDINIRFYIGPNIHVNRTNHLRAFRRNGVWRVETSEDDGYSSARLLPPPEDYQGTDHPSLQCYSDHTILRGDMNERLETALDAFLADGCRSQIPILAPAPLFLKNADGLSCSDGAASILQIETADGVERYIQRCAIPGSSLAALMSALESTRSPDNAQIIGPGLFATITVDEFYEAGGNHRACPIKAEALYPDIDFDDPWQW